MKYLSEDQIKQMKKLTDATVKNYGLLVTMMDRYEEIYWMTNPARLKDMPGADPDDVKNTISSAGRDAVVGLKRIMDTAKVHVKVVDAKDNDKIEAALLKMLKVSGEFKMSSVEKDINLSTALFGPAALSVELVDDLITTQTREGKEPNEYVIRQLELIQRKTPFLIHVRNAKQSFPIWGAYGMVGHVSKYTIKGAEVRDRWGVEDVEDNKDYVITDTFHYEKRLTMAEGIDTPLMACEWVTRGKDGKIIGSISIPVFVRYAGGTSLFSEPEKQMQPLLYAMAKGEWDLRDTLFWTYVFTAIYRQGLPGKTLVIDPDYADQTIRVNYKDGIKTVVAKGQFADMKVIDSDVLQLRGLMDEQNARNTIQPQTLGANTQGVTFSQFAIANKAGLIPAQDPKDAMEAVYRDAFTHILERIKHEGIDNDLLQAADIPEKIELEVTIEPDLAQDDLRNAQVAAQLRNGNSNISDEWINTNILKIANSKEMRKQKDKEDVHKAIIQQIVQNPEIMNKYVMAALGEGGKQPTQPTEGGMQGQPAPAETIDRQPTPEEMAMMQAQGGAGMEQMPKTDAMIPPGERI